MRRVSVCLHGYDTGCIATSSVEGGLKTPSAHESGLSIVLLMHVLAWELAYKDQERPLTIPIREPHQNTLEPLSIKSSTLQTPTICISPFTFNQTPSSNPGSAERISSQDAQIHTRRRFTEYRVFLPQILSAKSGGTRLDTIQITNCSEPGGARLGTVQFIEPSR